MTRVPTSYAGGIPSELKNIIYQSPSITIEMCQCRAFTRYSTPLGEHDPIPARPWMEAPIDPANIAGDKDRFYDRVNGNVVVELVKNILTPKGWNDLMLQQEKFSFYNSMGEKSYDGPTLLKVVIEEIDPTASVNIELHRQAIEGAKLHQYKGNVVEMLKDIEQHHQAIVANGFEYDQDTFRCHLLAALLSGSNADFNSKVNLIKNDVDACYGYNAKITPGDLIKSCKHQYQNIARCGEWNNVYPRDAQIMALTTALENKGTTAPNSNPAPTANPVTDAAKEKEKAEFFAWRIDKKGATATWKGREHVWCPHHKKDGVFDGMYYNNHTPDTHDEWKERVNARYKNRVGKKAANAAEPEGPAKSMRISDALRNALCTNLCVSEEDLNKIVESADF